MLAGIQTDPEGAGFEKIIIEPHIIRDIATVSAAVKTLRGRIAVSWRKENEQFFLKVEIPGNSTARIFFPKLETAAASISEGDHLVWDRTGFHDGCPVVEFGEEHDGSIILNVGSGVYSFLLI